MNIKKILVILFAICCTVPGMTETKAAKNQELQLKSDSTSIASQPAPAKVEPKVDPIVLSNQMMITFMDRMKTGNLKEAEQIAAQMIYGHDKFQDTPKVEFKTFATLMEKRLYETFSAQEGKNATVDWITQPIADGFYFYAMLAFQEKNVEKALEHLQKAIQWNPVHAPYFVERGFMLLHTNPIDLAQAQIAYLRALELADNYADFAAALRGIGFVLIEKGDLEGGVACYLRSQLYDPQDQTAAQEINFVRARAPKAGKDLDGIRAAGVLSERRIPSGISAIHIKVLMTIAGELETHKKTKELKAVLRRALQLDPKNQQIVQKLSSLK